MQLGERSIDNINYFDTSAVSPAVSASFVQPLQAKKKESKINNMMSPRIETKYIPHRNQISNEY